MRALGIDFVVYGPHEYEPCTMSVIEDPWGHLLVLHHRKDGTVG